MLIFCSTIPLFANFVYVFFPQALGGVEITPVMFTISGILLFFALFYYKLLDLSPVAWETIIESLDYGIVLFNSQHLVVDFNRPFINFFEIGKPLIGTPIHVLLGRYPQITRFIDLNQGKKTEVSISKNNKRYFLQLECSPIYDKKNKNIMGKILLVRDITQEKLSQQKIKLSEEKFRTLFEHSIDGIYITTPQGKYVGVNTALVKMLGYRNKKELMAIDIEKDLYVSADERPGPDQRNRIFKTRLKKKDKSIIDVEISSRVIYEQGKPKYYQGIVRDITERKKIEERLKYLSFHDSLTGLYNRSYFQEEVKRINSDIKRFRPVSIISVDINNLKLVNDRHGHQQGDEFIKNTARILSSFIRKTDILARIGGDEFCAILPKTKPATANQRRKELRDRIEAYNKQNKLLGISIAIGIATTKDNEGSINGAIKRADKSMYAHKMEMKSKNQASSPLA